MKRLLPFAIIATLALSLTACGDKPTDKPTPPSGNSTPAGSVTPPTNTLANPTGAVNGYKLLYKGTNIVLGSNIEDLFSEIGQPTEKQTHKVESCAFRGYDITYLLDAIDISTFSPDGTAYHVLEVKLLNDLLLTSNGAHMGMTKEQIISRYGEPTSTSETGRLRYEKDGMSLTFTFSGAGEAIEIVYRFDGAEDFRIDG